MVESLRCLRCGKYLTDPKSIKRGFGPICWPKVRHLIEEHEEYEDLLKGPKETNDYPAIQDYLQYQIRNTCECGADMSEAPANHYEHHKGVPLHGYKKKQWIFLTCLNCGKQWALWKLGILAAREDPAQKTLDEAITGEKS